MNEQVITWFYRWLERHKAHNRHNGWAAFEEPGRMAVYFAWIKAFQDRGVTEVDADAASLRMAQMSSAWPEEHLSRLLQITAPWIAGREADASSARRRRESEAWARDQAAYLEAKSRWLVLPGDDREAMLASIRRRYPTLAGLPRLAEHFAVDEWRGVPLPEPSEGDEVPALVAFAPGTQPDEPAPTPGQVEFLEALTPEERARFDAMVASRRREILAPHAGGFNPSLMPVIAVELRSCEWREVATA